MSDAVQIKDFSRRVIRRYKKAKTTYTRMFAYFKATCDSMFSELGDFTDASDRIRTIIDIGTGYGVPAAWFLEKYPEAVVYGIDPDLKRVRAASEIFGIRACIEHGRAPDIPKVPVPADLALMIDMIHYLNDDELTLTLERVHQKLVPDSRLIIRTAVPPSKTGSWMWYFENLKLGIRRIGYDYRSADRMSRMLGNAGFRTELIKRSGTKGESVWFIAGA